MLIAATHLHLCSRKVRLGHSWSRGTGKCLHMPLQAVSKAETGVTEAEKRLMQLQKDKEELDRQLQQTQKAVLAGKEKVEKLREEIQRRTEARTVSVAPVRPCAYDNNTALHICLSSLFNTTRMHSKLCSAPLPSPPAFADLISCD